MKVQWSVPQDPLSWGSGSTHLLTVPNWLGGAWTASYIVTHAWTRWLILWPLMKLKKLRPDGEGAR